MTNYRDVYLCRVCFATNVETKTEKIVDFVVIAGRNYTLPNLRQVGEKFSVSRRSRKQKTCRDIQKPKILIKLNLAQPKA